MNIFEETSDATSWHCWDFWRFDMESITSSQTTLRRLYLAKNGKCPFRNKCSRYKKDSKEIWTPTKTICMKEIEQRMKIVNRKKSELYELELICSCIDNGIYRADDILEMDEDELENHELSDTTVISTIYRILSFLGFKKYQLVTNDMYPNLSKFCDFNYKKDLMMKLKPIFDEYKQKQIDDIEELLGMKNSN